MKRGGGTNRAAENRRGGGAEYIIYYVLGEFHGNMEVKRPNPYWVQVRYGRYSPAVMRGTER